MVPEVCRIWVLGGPPTCTIISSAGHWARDRESGSPPPPFPLKNDKGVPLP